MPHKSRLIYVIATSILLATTPLLAEDPINEAKQQEEVVALVKEAADYIKENGKQVAITEFNKTNGKFTHGSVYIFAADYNGIVQAYVNKPERIGQNGLKSLNAKGQSIIAKLIEIAKAGGGWYKYREENPSTQQIECKNSYIMPMKDYYIGSGYYYASDARGEC